MGSLPYATYFIAMLVIFSLKSDKQVILIEKNTVFVDLFMKNTVKKRRKKSIIKLKRWKKLHF